MKILGILQNQWFKDPDKVRLMLARSSSPDRLRRHLITYALFAGCRTGKVLRQVFGDLCDEIIWDEASKELGSKASACFEADLKHLSSLIQHEQPDIIIAFGQIACNALRPMFQPLIEAPHPTARTVNTITRLQQASVELDLWLKQQALAAQAHALSQVAAQPAPR